MTLTQYPVASGPDYNPKGIHPDSVRTGRVADPTAETAIRNILKESREADFAVVDQRGNVLFQIKPDVLKEALSLYRFTRTRRGRNSIRAHSKKNAPGTSSQDGRGNESATPTAK